MAYDEVNSLLSLVSGAWAATNTDSKTPTFNRVIDVKKIPTAAISGYDYVLGYQVSREHVRAGLGKSDKENLRISLDYRSDGNGITDKRAHALKVRDEIIRILRLNYGTRVDGVYYVQGIVSEQDLSDKMRMLYRHVIDVEMWRWVSV